MKTLFYITISLFGLTLFSCQDKGHKSNEKISTPYRKILHGVWIPDNYIKEIKKTMSPIAASIVLKGYSELTIDTTKIEGDSLFVSGGWNNHEGGGFYMWFKPGQINTSFPTNNPDYDNRSNFYELGYKINQKDTSLILYHYDKNKKILDKSYFSKVSEVSATLSDGLQCFVNSVLIKGKYKLLSNGQTVEFTNAGQVIGLDNFKKYFIQTDFVVMADNDIDNIIFDVYSNKQIAFAYKLKKDTLDFFTTKSDSTGLPMLIDSLQYRLVRQR
jgi:hypothetical protein